MAPHVVSGALEAAPAGSAIDDGRRTRAHARRRSARRSARRDCRARSSRIPGRSSRRRSIRRSGRTVHARADDARRHRARGRRRRAMSSRIIRGARRGVADAEGPDVGRASSAGAGIWRGARGRGCRRSDSSQPDTARVCRRIARSSRQRRSASRARTPAWQQTGSIVVASGPGRGRLASLLPPVHVALVRRDSLIVVAAGAHRRAPGARHAGANFVCITGPSRTADIEHVLAAACTGREKCTSCSWTSRLPDSQADRLQGAAPGLGVPRHLRTRPATGPWPDGARRLTPCAPCGI